MMGVKNIRTGRHFEAVMTIDNTKVSLHDIESSVDTVTTKKDIILNYEPCGIRV